MSSHPELPLRPDPPGEDATLREVRPYVDGLKAEGGACPACGQSVKLYRRKLDATMARLLLRLVKIQERNGGRGWYHVRALGDETGCLSLLEWWGLVQQATNSDTAKRCSGRWAATPRGVAFAKGQIAVASHVFLYNNRVEGWGARETTIRDALGKKFNYEELWLADEPDAPVKGH